MDSCSCMDNSKDSSMNNSWDSNSGMGTNCNSRDTSCNDRNSPEIANRRLDMSFQMNLSLPILNPGHLAPGH